MTETQHVIALNPYRKGNKGKVFSNSMAVYDKVIASPEIRKMIQQIRGELPIPKVDANDEKAVKKAQDRLKSELPFFCPHYGIFKTMCADRRMPSLRASCSRLSSTWMTGSM